MCELQLLIIEDLLAHLLLATALLTIKEGN